MILCLVIENGIDFIKSFKELTRKTSFSFLFSCSSFSSNNLNIKAVCRMRYSNHRFFQKNTINKVTEIMALLHMLQNICEDLP